MQPGRHRLRNCRRCASCHGG
ncbi:MAG: hypothetical protein ACN6O2_05980 [Stenotrophomonas sp.]